jgi:hypothetical protein
VLDHIRPIFGQYYRNPIRADRAYYGHDVIAAAEPGSP